MRGERFRALMAKAVAEGKAVVVWSPETGWIDEATYRARLVEATQRRARLIAEGKLTSSIGPLVRKEKK